MRKYVFKPYNDIFPTLFEKEKQRLSSYIHGQYSIEHAGSTAIPGLGGKGIIDIYITALEKELETISKAVEKAGYAPQKRVSDDLHVFHKIDLPDPIDGTRRYHIHINICEANDYKNAMLFRDYLRNHPSDAKKYAQAKMKAAKIANEDKDTYMDIKEPVIDEILRKALTK